MQLSCRLKSPSHSGCACVRLPPLPVLPPGFLPRIDPLRQLPQAELQPWEAMAAALPSLLAVGQARKPLEALPELSIGELLILDGWRDDRQQYLDILLPRSSCNKLLNNCDDSPPVRKHLPYCGLDSGECSHVLGCGGVPKA